jgi:catechol 2,3-dioxygenase-like lactoylglutathione lyase family enzyme
MLQNALAQATLPASDMDRAKRWYQEKLGLSPAVENEAGTFYVVGRGTLFGLYPTPNTNRGGHTQLALIVQDIDAEVSELRSRGVVFEEYDFPGLKTVDGIADTGGGKGGWFKDSEGNIIGIIQPAVAFEEVLAALAGTVPARN